MLITLQIPTDKYGQLATLAAVAGMPIDKYVVDTVKEPTKSEPTTAKPSTEK